MSKDLFDDGHIVVSQYKSVDTMCIQISQGANNWVQLGLREVKDVVNVLNRFIFQEEMLPRLAERNQLKQHKINAQTASNFFEYGDKALGGINK